MKILPILIHPAKSLHERSVEVDPKAIGTYEFQAYLEVLINTLKAEINGIGLASPQIGRNERIIVVTQGRKPVVFINPAIIKKSETTTIDEEGCLSVPDVWGMVERAKKISVAALDRHGRQVELDCKGLEAVIFQHEIDHLDGVLFIDKVKEYTKGEDKLKSAVL